MKSLERLIGKRVALVDRGFVLAEGRIVYPTAEGILRGVDTESGTVEVELRNDQIPTLFFLEAMRAVRELPELSQEAEKAEAPIEVATDD